MLQGLLSLFLALLNAKAMPVLGGHAVQNGVFCLCSRIKICRCTLFKICLRITG